MKYLEFFCLSLFAFDCFDKTSLIRFPFIACEIFTCEIDVILKTLVEEEEVQSCHLYLEVDILLSCNIYLTVISVIAANELTFLLLGTKSAPQCLAGWVL